MNKDKRKFDDLDNTNPNNNENTYSCEDKKLKTDLNDKEEKVRALKARIEARKLEVQKQKELAQQPQPQPQPLPPQANYYNYFRKLEIKVPHESTGRSRVGLLPKSNVVQNKFELTDFEIQAEVTDSSCISVFTQHYKNDSTSPVEATYRMPLPPYATVCDFSVTYDDKVLKGKIKEKEKAQQKYSDSIASGGQAFLAEKSDDGYFTLSIGNLPPSKQVTVSISIISEIGAHLESLHYCLHRYMFPSNSFNLNFKLFVSLSAAIENITIDHYKSSINYSNGKKKAIIEFQSYGVSKNIVTVITPVLSTKPEYFIEHSKADNTYAVALNFYPKFNVSRDEIDQKAEFIFLLDCSGSMSGSSINQAKKALEIIMRSLSENVKFNIYTFGSTFKKLFDVSKLYDDETLESASAHISRIDANLGGTELLPPVRDILALPYDPEYPRQVMIFTDGEISERDALIDFVGKESNTTRIFTFGIGLGVDKELVVGLSKACKGYYEMIKDNSKMEAQVLSLLGIALEPTLSNIKVDWNQSALTVTQAPNQIRPIYSGERMMIYGYVEKKISESSTIDIVLTGNGPTGRTLSFPVTLDFSNVKDDSNHLHSLAAFNIINDLEESERKTKADHKERIVQLGKKFTLISKHTSFVVTAESDQVTTDTMVSHEILPTVTPTLPNIVLPSFAPSFPGGGGLPLSNNGPVLYRRSSSPNSSDSDGDDGLDEDDSLGSEEENDKMDLDENLDNIYDSLSQVKAIQTNMCLDISESLCQQSEMLVEEEKESSLPPRASFFSSLSKDSHNKKKKEKSSPSLYSPSKKLSSPTSLSYSPSSPSPKPSSTSIPSLSSPKPKVSTGDLLMDLIKAQKANGSWVSSSVSFTIPTAPSAFGSLPVEIWITLIVISKITKSFPDKSTQWDLVVQKATKWVKSQLNKENKSEEFDNLLKLSQSAI